MTKTWNKACLLLMLIIVHVYSAKSQDTLHLYSGKNLAVRIWEITSKEVRFQKYANDDQTLFAIPKSNIQSITYQDGEKEDLRDLTNLENKSVTSANMKYRAGKFFLVDNITHSSKRLYHKDMQKLLWDPESIDAYKLHRGTKVGSYIFAGIGIGLAAYSIGLTVTNIENLDNANAILGVALGTIIVFELPFTIVSTISAKKTAKIYNQGQQTSHHTSLGVGITKHGIGLVMNF